VAFHVVYKVVWALFCCVCFVVVLPMIPVSNLGDSAWLAAQPHWWVLIWNQISMSLLRHRYYFAWVLCDAGCNAAGFGYDGEDASSGAQKWNRVLNLDVRPRPRPRPLPAPPVPPRPALSRALTAASPRGRSISRWSWRPTSARP
jgi:hypothetical protein